MQSPKDPNTSLSEINEELENYFANTIIPQLFVDANLVLRKFTPPAMKQFKLKDEFIDKPLEDVKENFRYPTIIDNIKVVIATGKILEKEIQTTDRCWYQMNILPYIQRKEQRMNGVIITFIDITQRITDLKEQEKFIAEQELLLDTIAHDIKNPINALGLTLQLIKKLSPDNLEKYPYLIENLERGLTDMKKVVDGLVESHWERQRYHAEVELLDLQNILEDVRITLAPQILETQATIKENFTVTELTFVRRKLRSLLYNLLHNAIKYTPLNRSPEIELSTYKEEGYIVIAVSDNGIGISEENKQSIFEKFRRIRIAEDGSGVGLYLVNTIVSSSGGKITLDSEIGKGTTFKVFLKLDS